jgi:hypothetical protein
MGASPPAQVADLVERFSRDRKVFLSPDCKEEQLRAEFGQRTGRLRFPNPFFTALGWDLDNKAGLSETFQQVIRGAFAGVTVNSAAPESALHHNA